MAVGTAIPEAPSDDRRWRIVETRMHRLGQRPDALMEVLHEAQVAFAIWDTDALAYIAHSLGVPLSKVYGVEAVIRCYDPCLSCSTHAIGQMPLHLRLLAPVASPCPETLAGVSVALYGAVPPMVLVSVAGGSFDECDCLSAALERALPGVVEVVADLVTGQHRV